MKSLLGKNERWKIVQEDCIEHMAKMPAASVDFSVFSPPFPSLFAYTDEACDIGNNDDVRQEAKLRSRYSKLM